MNNPVSAQNSIIAVWLVSGNTIALALKKAFTWKKILTCVVAHFLNMGQNNILMKHIFFVRRYLRVVEGVQFQTIQRDGKINLDTREDLWKRSEVG